MSDCLGCHGLQHAWLLCPLLSPWVCSNSCPLSQWCYVTISSSVTPFSSCPPSFLASGLTNSNCFIWYVSQLIGKDPDAGKDWRQKEKGMAEDEIVREHHWLNGHEFEQTQGDSKGQESLVCCSPRGHKESDTTQWLNNNKNVHFLDITLLYT